MVDITIVINGSQLTTRGGHQWYLLQSPCRRYLTVAAGTTKDALFFLGMDLEEARGTLQHSGTSVVVITGAGWDLLL